MPKEKTITRISIQFKERKVNIHNSSILLFVVSVSILTMPFFEGSDAERFFVSLLLTTICALEIYSDVKIPFFYRVQLVVGIVSVIFAWFTKVESFPQSLLFTEHLFFFIFFLLATITAVHEFEKFIYYSFVTLTTVGYGDITPNSSAAKVLTIFLCTAGQLYLTVLVGLIVGKYISKLNIEARKS